MINVFSYSLLRIAGSPFEDILPFIKSHLDELLLDMDLLENKINQLKNSLSNQLLLAIKSQEENKVKNLLQNFRRDIYNDRTIKQANWETVKIYLSKDLIKAYINLNYLKKELSASGDKWRINYNAALLQSRQDLTNNVKHNEVLKKGLVLSAPGLLEKILKLENKSPENFKKKDFHTEKNILKYLTRIITKTSPFSTFTNLGILSLKEKLETNIKIKSIDKNSIVSTFRMNNLLVKYLKGLLFNYRNIYLYFLIRPNPSIELKKNQYSFLINFNNIESFQKLEHNPVLELILQRLAKNQEGVHFEKLIAFLAEQIDADSEQLESFIRELLDYGLLEFNLGVSGVDPDWDIKLKEVLSPYSEKVKHIKELIQTLEKMRVLGDSLASVSASSRKDILREAHLLFKETYFKIHEAAGLPEEERKIPTQYKLEKKENEKPSNSEKQEENKIDDQDKVKEQEEKFSQHLLTHFSIKPYQIYFEDTVKNVDASIKEASIKAFLDKVLSLVEHVYLIPFNTPEIERMKAYFLDKYDITTSISILQFYEDYFRDVKKPHEKYETAKNTNGAKVTPAKPEDGKEVESVDTTIPKYYSIEKIQSGEKLKEQWKAKSTKHFKTKFNHLTKIAKVNSNDLSEINSGLNIKKGFSPFGSKGSFIQFFEEDNTLKGFIPFVVTGYGKWMGRFLHILPNHITKDTLAWNKQTLEKDALQIENTDATYFNANLHPTLMPYELQTPGGHNYLEEAAQLRVSDFKIKFCKETDELELFHNEKNQRAFIHNLGFQSPNGRSKLFQLISTFGKNQYFGFTLLTKSINNIFEEQHEKIKKIDNIIRFPRIVYENVLVIQRHKWEIGKNRIPIKSSLETDGDYYRKIRKWIKKNELPSTVFIKLNPLRMPSYKLKRDDYKPQYINFQSPLLVRLFEKMTKRIEEFIVIEEMLPSKDHLIEDNGKHWVTECIIQWDEMDRKDT